MADLKPLRIPYAIDLDADEEISAEDIAEAMDDLTSDIRLRATATKNTTARRTMRFVCPACGQQVYPHAPAYNGTRYFWSHLPRGAYSCPLESKRKLTPDQINQRIFYGRQEGEAHKKLVMLLSHLAAAHPATVPASVEVGVYERPTPEIRDEFPYGRFPDVKFAIGETRAVLEAQLATITLHGINGRRAFYDRSGIRLLWVMRNFDPSGPLRVSVKDIVADQGGVLFSIDREVEAAIALDNRFRLRAWTYRANDTGGSWADRIASIEECLDLAKPNRWADAFKTRWIKAYQGRSYHDAVVPNPESMLRELIIEAGVGDMAIPASTLRLVRLLISLESGIVTGAATENLIPLANSFEIKGGHQALALVRKAIKLWQSDLLEKPSVQRAISRAERLLRERGEHEWGQKSVIGRIREVLFPDWRL